MIASVQSDGWVPRPVSLGRTRVDPSRAYERGKRAFQQGVSFNQCTYGDIDNVAAWERGYRDAQAEKERS